MEPRTRTPTLREPAQSIRMSVFYKRWQKPLYTEIERKNAAAQIEPRTRTHILRKRAQSKYTLAFHKKHQKMHFIFKFTGKIPQIKMSPERWHAFCVNLHSRNECQDFARATFYGNFRKTEISGKMRRPRTRTPILREPAQSKRMSRLGKDHFMGKFTGKKPRPRVRTLIKHRPLQLA